MNHPSLQFKQILWVIFYIIGSYITFTTVFQNYRKYSRFDSVMIQRQSEQGTKFFPKVLICLNSMHSKAKGHGQTCKN